MPCRGAGDNERQGGNEMERCGEQWLSPKRAAAYCGCGEERMRRAIHTGEIPSVEPPGAHEGTNRRLVNKDDLDEFMLRRRVEPGKGCVAARGAA